jgi:26S proteasome regulatory subunit T5
MIELLNHLDGYLIVYLAFLPMMILRMRSGRLDRKIEFPHPNEDARVQILKIHSRKMKHKEVNFTELARSTDDFNGAMLKAVCVEAGMQALRRGGTYLVHEDYV